MEMRLLAGRMTAINVLPSLYTRFVHSVSCKLDYNITVDREDPQPSPLPGIGSHKCISVDPVLQKHLYKVIDREGFSIDLLKHEAPKVGHFVRTRRLPWEKAQMKESSNKIITQMNRPIPTGLSSEEIISDLDAKEQKLWSKKMRSLVYNWQPLLLDTRHKCVEYALARLSQNYAAVTTVLNEIALRDPQFDPAYVLDHASGLGTNISACLNIFDSVKQAMMVDISPDASLLAKDILLDEKGDPLLEEIYYRLSLPMSTQDTFDLTICSYHLLDLPSRVDRLNMLAQLWQRTSGYLVLIDNGTLAGFDAILEARDFLLQVGPRMPFLDTVDQPPASNIHVFSPCPHDLPCPKLKLEGKNKKACRMSTRVMPLAIFEGQKEPLKETFCYVVLKRTGREEQGDNHWPRLVSDVFPGKCTNCLSCCSDGIIRNLILSPGKSGKLLHKYGKRVTVGDRLPVTLKDMPAPSVASDAQ